MNQSKHCDFLFDLDGKCNSNYLGTKKRIVEFQGPLTFFLFGLTLTFSNHHKKLWCGNQNHWAGECYVSKLLKKAM